MVIGVDKGGKDTGELGMARVSLEDMVVNKGKDLPLTPLPVTNEKKENVGDLTCAITAQPILPNFIVKMWYWIYLVYLIQRSIPNLLGTMGLRG